MRKNWIHHINIKNILSKATLLLTLFIFSCSDKGCIDADDFGEYESETIEILSNASSDNCTYYPALELTSPDQGEHIKECLAQGVAYVYDDDDNVVSSEDDDNESATDKDLPGCAGFVSASNRNKCIQGCVSKCLLEATSNSGLSQPNWNSTNSRTAGFNSGVTIRPNSEIMVTASGSVNFGDNVEFDSSYVNVDQLLPHSYDSSDVENFFNVKNGQFMNLNFSSQWTNGGPPSYNLGGASPISDSGDSDSDIALYNASRRLAVFAISYPDGHSFDGNAASEKSGSLGVPLLPDPFAWTCSYIGNDLTQSTCGHKTDSYTSIGYNANVNNDLTESTFHVSSAGKTDGLTTYGGFIRWDDDGLQNSDYDPFQAATIGCNLVSGEFECGDTSTLGIEGQFVDKYNVDPDDEITIPHPSSSLYSYQVSFKSLAPDTSCNFDGTETEGFRLRIVDKYNYTLDATKMPVIGTPNEVSLPINDSWSSYQIALEPNQTIKIPPITTGGKENCRRVIAVRFLRYHDLKIQTSGFINFTTLNAGSGSCYINGRIINPEGSHSNDTFKIDDNDSPNDSSLHTTSAVTGFTADFYEYDNFTVTSSTDPLNNLQVTPSGPSVLNWGDSVFVRKGQIIRFSPNSWDGTFLASTGPERNCGIGMAMRIIPRPALLCRGKNSEYVQNKNCTTDYNDDYEPIGCNSFAAECLDPDSSSYCPLDECRATLNCTDAMIPGSTSGSNPDDGLGPYYAKTCSDLTLTSANQITPKDASCEATDEGGETTTEIDGVEIVSVIPTLDFCTSCSQAMLTQSRKPSKIPVTNLDQCYDLENYKGKVANIPVNTGFTEDQLSDTYKRKGADKLGSFNGKYGNFKDFYDTKEQDVVTGNRVFQLSTPILLGHNARMQFFALDGNNFNNSFTGAAGSGSVYDNNTGAGYKVNATASLTANNGEWLQMSLCQDDGTDSICDNVNLAPQVANQPIGVVIDKVASSPASAILTSSSPYHFNGYGDLVRTKDKDVNKGDCGTTKAGSYFYCHTVPDEDDNISNLRLSFQIIDPEEATCVISDPTSTDDTAYNGIIISNPNYDVSDSDNHNTICPADTTTTPLSACKKELYCSNKYSNNHGSYFVKVKVKNAIDDNATSIIKSVITPIIEVMDGDIKNCNTTGAAIGSDGMKTETNIDNATIGTICTLEDFENDRCNGEFYCKAAEVGQAERIYKLLIADKRYKAIVTMSLVLMVTFYGLTFLMGVSELNHAELVNRIIKIGLIYLFIGEAGWHWFDTFVVKFFKEGTDYLAFLMASSFDTTGEINTAIADRNYYDKSILFKSVDTVFNMFFSDAVLKKLSALLFASIFGWAYLLIIIYGFGLYVLAVANAVLLYLTAQVFISILFTLGPIFFLFTLFDKTKEMFDNWLKQLIGFSLQQIFLLTTLAFFNMMMYEVIKMSLGYKICWEEIWTITVIVRISLLSWWNIASLPPRTNSHSEVGNIGNPEGIPSLFTILFIWIIASLMNKFIGFMTELASQISGGLSAQSLGAGVMDAASGLKKSLGGKAEELAKKYGVTKGVQRLDRYLFDSGKLADSDRLKKSEDRSKLSAQKNRASTAGDEAVKKKENEIKKKGGKMTKEDKAQTRKDGMIAEFKRMGMDEDEIENAMKDKGMKPSDMLSATAVIGSGISALRSGTMNKSFNNGSASNEKETVYSASEAKEAMENMDTDEEREDFQNKVDSGEIKVERSKVNKIYGAAGSVKRGAKSAKKTATANAKKGIASFKKGKDAFKKKMESAKNSAKEKYASATNGKDQDNETGDNPAEETTPPKTLSERASAFKADAAKARQNFVKNAKKAGSKISSGASQAINKADSLALGGEKGLEAEKLLVASGAIKKPQGVGRKGLYSKADKKKIAALKQTMAVDNPKGTDGDIGAASDLRRHAEKLNDPSQTSSRSKARENTIKSKAAAHKKSLNKQLNETSAALKDNDRKKDVLIPNRLDAIDKEEADYVANNPSVSSQGRAGNKTLEGFDKERANLNDKKDFLEAKSGALESKKENLTNLINNLPEEQKEKENSSSTAMDSGSGTSDDNVTETQNPLHTAEDSNENNSNPIPEEPTNDPKPENKPESKPKPENKPDPEDQKNPQTPKTENNDDPSTREDDEMSEISVAEYGAGKEEEDENDKGTLKSPSKKDIPNNSKPKPSSAADKRKKKYQNSIEKSQESLKSLESIDKDTTEDIYDLEQDEIEYLNDHDSKEIREDLEKNKNNPDAVKEIREKDMKLNQIDTQRNKKENSLKESSFIKEKIQNEMAHATSHEDEMREFDSYGYTEEKREEINEGLEEANLTQEDFSNYVDDRLETHPRKQVYGNLGHASVTAETIVEAVADHKSQKSAPQSKPQESKAPGNFTNSQGKTPELDETGDTMGPEDKEDK